MNYILDLYLVPEDACIVIQFFPFIILYHLQKWSTFEKVTNDNPK